jgi:hypothetical protein
MKKLIPIVLFIFISNPVLCADYEIQELPVQSSTLDNVSDSYQITVKKGNYKFINPLEHDKLKSEIKKYYKPVIYVTLGLAFFFICPELVLGLGALKEADEYVQEKATIKQGESVNVLVPAGEKPQLVKE